MRHRGFTTAYIRYKGQFVAVPEFLTAELRRVNLDATEHNVKDGEVDVLLTFLDGQLHRCRYEEARWVLLQRRLKGLARDMGILVRIS